MSLLIFLTYTGFVAYVSLRPMGGASLENWDKVGHVAIYLVYALIGYHLASGRRQYLYICAGIFVYSGLMEIAQSFMPGRMMSVYDLLANAVGVSMAIVFTRALFGVKNI